MFDMPDIPSFAPPDADRPVPTELMGKIAVQEELALSAEELQGKGSKDAIIGMWAEKNASLFAELLQTKKKFRDLVTAQGVEQDSMRFEEIAEIWKGLIEQKKALKKAQDEEDQRAAREAEEHRRQKAERPNTW